MMFERWRLAVVAVVAAAMAFMEAATVLYLRALVGRLEPYQPDPLPLSLGFGAVELTREAATLVLLLGAAALAGATWRARVGYWLVAFGVWDVLYYAFLGLVGPWPRSLWDWDVLFLLPLPWWGPVLAPVAVAALMTLTGTMITHSSGGWPRPYPWRLAAAGAVLAFVVFTADALAALPSGAREVQHVLPASFHWGWFLVALSLMAAPACDLLLQRAPLRSSLARDVPLHSTAPREGTPRRVEVASENLSLRTDEKLQFVDVTERVSASVRRSGISDGLVCVQSRHTTAAVVVNENEPLLLQDLRATLERLAPRELLYSHDDLAVRANPAPDESRNGAAHCKALVLPSAATLRLAEGRIDLGPWQRIFLVELDGPRPRSVAVLVLGAAAETSR